MRARILLRRALIGLVASIALLVAFGTLLGLALDAGYFKEPFIRFVSAGIGRQILVQGPLHAHVFSFHPQFSAEGVEIGNPAWMPAGLTAKIGNLSLVLTVPHIGASGNFGLETLDAAAAFFYLARDAAGRANWQWTDPALGRHKTAAIVRSLRIPNARVVLDDVPRHLHFDGTVSAQQANTADKQEPLRIEGVGQMNGRETSIDITADSLVTAAHERPFHFSFAERSSGSRLTGRGFLPLPFDFSVLETTFDAAGANLKDLFFLTGVTLINTGAYHLHGQLIRQGSILKFSDLVATSKSSDVHGELSIDVSNSRPQFAANLESQVLRAMDFGTLAAQHAEPGKEPILLLSDARFDPKSLRNSDGVIDFRVGQFEMKSLSAGKVRAKASLEHGILVVSPLAADVLGGKLAGHVKLDARTDSPAAEADLLITDLQLGEIDRKPPAPAPLEGILQTHIAISGHGRSIHEVGASANGRLTAILPHGSIRESLAELTGIDLRGLGLSLTKSTQETGIRCAVAAFSAHDGVLTAQNLMMDTDTILINGGGQVQLDTETMHLQVQGHPKGLRIFRLRAPVLLRGSLSHPSILVQARRPVADAAEKGVSAVVTPLVSALKIVDPGRAKDTDCAALIAAVSSNEGHVPAAASPH